MKKVIALCALLCILAFSVIACGPPSRSSTQAAAAKAKTTVSVNVASAKVQLARASFESARQLRAVEATTTAETAVAIATTKNIATAQTFVEPGALNYRQAPFDHSADIAKVMKLPNTMGYNGFAGDHAPRADV